jgi:hypothetical protein
VTLPGNAHPPPRVGMKSSRWLDGRALLFALASGFGAWMAFLPKPQRMGEWQVLGVPPLSEAFGDLRVVTTGWDCWRRGIDVLAGNPCDPWARPMNYPRLWLLPGLLGLGESATVILGIAICMGFLGAMMLLVGRLGLTDTIIYGAALASPAVLLAVERGNTDLAVFALCVAGLAAIQRLGSAGTALGVALILVATMLKLYPVFALVVLVPRTRLVVVALAVAAIYALLTLPDLALISQGTPRPYLYAYGTVPVAVAAKIGLRTVGLVIVAAALLTSSLGIVRRTAEAAVPSLALDAFLVGGAMFLGTFLIGNNYMYRLLLTLMTMPQLLQWMRNPGTRLVATPILLVVLALLWLSAATRDAGPGNNAFQALSVALFVALGGLLTAIIWTQTSATRRRLLLVGAHLYRGRGAGSAGLPNENG